MLARATDNTSYYNLNNRDMLREVIVKIGLERIDIQEEVTVEALLDSSTTGLVVSSEFARKQELKLKKIENLIYMRNVDGTFNKKGSIENTVEVNIYYQGYRERIEINVIGGQKQNVILRMLWLAYHNPKIDQRTGEIKMMRCLEECRKQWRPKQGKLEQQKQKEKEKKEEARREQEEKEKRKKEKKKPKKEQKIEVRKIAEEWKIWDKEEEAVMLGVEIRKLVPERFYKQIYIFGKKISKQMPTRKLWDHMINTKEKFIPRKGKTYLLLREEKEEVHKFISEQLRKGYIRLLKLSQTTPVFFVEKKDSKKRMVQEYWYLNE